MGAVIGALLLLLLLLLLIWLLVCCCHKRRYEKEVANEIRYDNWHSTHSKKYMPQGNSKCVELLLFCASPSPGPHREDVPAPESRPSSRNSSFRSVLGYRAHTGVVYSSVRKNQPRRTESGHSITHSNQSKGTPQPAPSEQKGPVLKYDSRYGYPV